MATIEKTYTEVKPVFGQHYNNKLFYSQLEEGMVFALQASHQVFISLDNKKEFYLEKRSWPEGQSLWLDEDGKVIGGNDFRGKELILVFFLSFFHKTVFESKLCHWDAKVKL